MSDIFKELPNVHTSISRAKINSFRKYTLPSEITLIPERQKALYSEMEFPESAFSSRVLIGYVQGNTVVEITPENHEEYSGLDRNFTQPNDFDAAWTMMPNVPIIGMYLDCANLLITSKDETLVGLLHANRSTLDKDIIKEFINQTKQSVQPSDLIIEFSPYLHPSNFYHTHIDKLERKDEWLEEGVLIPQNKGWYMDIGFGAKLDFIKQGVNPDNIYDARVNSYDMSSQSNNGKIIHSLAFWKSLTGKESVSQYFKEVVENNDKENAIVVASPLGIMLK